MACAAASTSACLPASVRLPARLRQPRAHLPVTPWTRQPLPVSAAASGANGHSGISWDGAAPRRPSAVAVERETAVAPAIDETEVDAPRTTTAFVAETLLPTRTGKFRVRAYRHTVGNTTTEPSVIIYGNVEGQQNVPVRVHDACFTSEVLGSMKCDCAEQLQLAMKYIQENGPGMVIYLQQEGRGIGLANKIAAYALQEQGLDTVDANRALGLPDDCREYTSVLNILQDLDVKSVQLMTNNPRKVNSLACMGIEITKRIPCVVQSNVVNQGYLDAKQARMDHDLQTDSSDNLLDGSWCYWDHSGDV
mmetsp:Transcript_46367/g.118386  ORF Transcript_46367/g.118386 Transcript_46367/m.118386 type:complete len:307 (+) Transcript_46367:152-1072(+)